VYRLLEAMRIDPRGFLDITRQSARRFHRKYGVPADLPCFSIPGDPPVSEVTWPLQRFHEVLAELEGSNDGLVPVESARAFGMSCPAWPADHFRQMNWIEPAVPSSICPPIPELYAHVVANLASLGFSAEQPCQEARRA
jgi:triacylglycerol lipase